MYGNDLENHMVDVDDKIGKWGVKPNIIGPPRGPIILGLTRRFPISSSTSTTWFSMSLLYVSNRAVFKVNHIVQGQPWAQPNPFYFCPSKTMSMALPKNRSLKFMIHSHSSAQIKY